MQNFLFVDLSSLTPGKPFAGFAVGKFVDMDGRGVEFKPAQLKAFLANTLKVLKAAKDKGMPGLPIDARGHDKGDAAGWIVGAELGEVEDSDGGKVGVIMLAAEWTKLGIELLRDKIMANFSPTVDLRGKVIRGGSLTNWPASVDGNGVPLFPAVELAEGMYRRATSEERRAMSGDAAELEESLDDRMAAIRNAWHKHVGQRALVDTWVVETFEEYLIVTVDGAAYRVDYAVDGDEITFAEWGEWVQVEQAWVEAQIGRKLTDAEMGKGAKADAAIRPKLTVKYSMPTGTAWANASSHVIKSPGATGRILSDGDGQSGDEVIDMTREEINELIAGQVRAALASELQQAARPAQAGSDAAGDGPPEFDVLRFLELGEATDDMVGAFKQQMLEQYEGMKKRASQEAAEMIGRIRRESDIKEFVQLSVGGSADVPYGLPVDARDLEEFLSHLQPSDLEFAKKMLASFQTHGRQKFNELGHGKQSQGGAELPAVYARQLDRGELTVADLSAPELGLGDVAQYDLSKWGGK